jgi:hypothetical protein
MGREKPGYADTFDVKVKTGNVAENIGDSVIIAGNEFSGFEETEIIETGIIYSWAHDFHLYFDDPEITAFVRADSINSPFTVKIQDIKPLPYPDLTFYIYCAYVRTKDNIYIGNAKRFAV